MRETNFGRLDLDGDEVIAERRYCDDASRWIRDVVVEQWVREGDGTLAAQTRTYYGDDSDTEPTFCQGELGDLSTGDLGHGWPRRVDSYLAQPRQLDLGEFVTTQRVRYNGQGNPIWTQDGRVERVLGYDSSGLFAVIEIVEPEPGRSLTWRVTSYDYVRGLVLEVADPNGVRSGAHYDDLGRGVAMRVNDYEPHVRYAYHWEGARPRTITYAWDGLLEDTPAAVAWSSTGQWRETIAVANGAGEGLFSAVRLADSEWLVSGWQMRDHKGRVNEVANPFSFAGGDPVTATLPDGWPRQTLTYDVLDRVITQTLPTGAEKHVIYKAFEATAVRADMDPVTSRLDGLGRVVYTERVVDGVVESVEAEYNALGAIERMVLLPGQQQEVVRTFGYDTQGRLLYSWDPDIGPRFYNWGTDGLLNFIDNGEGERTEFLYDQVGRLTVRRGSDGAEYRYHYDIRRTIDAPDPALRHALSRLSWVEEPGGLVELGYDELGRQTTVRRPIHDRTATETIEQTALGSVLRVTHDADFAYRIDYDAAGRPRVITSEPIDENAGYGELWRAEEIDEAGNIVRARYGNGVVQEGDYDNPLRLVGRVQILAPGGAPYYDARIDRSPFGILHGIVDQDGGAGLEHSATFTYDGGLRLTGATLGNDGDEVSPAWQYTFSYKYDGLQNMTERRATGPKELGMLTGIYRYEEEHCLGKRQLGSVLFDDGDTVQFFYDRAGRQVRAGDIEYVYNDLDQLIRVAGLDPLSVSGGVVEHGYGFDGLRTWTRGLDGTTQYWFTEAVTEHDGVRDHYVMFGGNVIAKVTQREVDDGTGGSGGAGGSITVIDAGRAAARSLALAVMALALALLAMTWRRSARSPWLARTAGVALCAMLAPACGVPPNSAARDLTWSQDDIVYFHYGAAPGPVIMTDANGMVFAERRYEPFGEPIDSFHHDPDGLGLVGDVDFNREPYNALNKQTDPDTQLSYHGARWMATETARWLTPDPPVKAPDPRFMAEPWGLHPYQYVNQNPVIFWDPDGRDKKDKLAVSVGKNYGCFIGGSSCSRMYERSVNGVEAPLADADMHEAVEYGSDVGMGFAKQAGRAVIGTAEAVYNYEETAEGLWHAVTHPVETWDAITDHYADQIERIADGDGEALGEVGFDVVMLLRGGAKGKKGKAPASEKPCPCFTEGTPVLTEDGLVAIEDIEAGTMVACAEPESGEWSWCEVELPLEKWYEGDLVVIEVGEETLEATVEHPFWVVAGEDLWHRPSAERETGQVENGASEVGRWVRAEDLAIGDSLRLSSGRPARVESLSTRATQTVVYNLSVARKHNYAVGAAGVLVHNSCCGSGVLKVPGRVQSRINVSNKGWRHVVDRHFNGTGSPFTISQAELKASLRSKHVVGTKVSRKLDSKDGPLYVREVEFDSPIGLDKFDDMNPTSTMTVLTDKYGNLKSAFPGRLE